MLQYLLKKIKSKKGFTLIELIFVITILGVLAGIAIPRLSGLSRNAKREANMVTARTIASAVSMAEAIYGEDVDIDNIKEFLSGIEIEIGDGSATDCWRIKLNPLTIWAPGEEDAIFPIEKEGPSGIDD